MRYNLTDEATGLSFSLEESFMTGRKTLTVNGQQAEVLGKNIFGHRREDGTTMRIVAKGNIFSGMVLSTDSGEIRFTRALKWYEYVFSLLPVYLLMGGAVGGVLAAVAFMINTMAMRGIKNIVLKLVVAVLITAAATLVYSLIVLALTGVFSFLPAAG